ncbi:MAG: hypothetical protein CFE21_13345 [Bacteroidetes bacterium B1(2017)]|nr:MAG: hypothetical protein CFE21_13345 [Bacteroidetes bacterium B1(2017)]
MKFNFGISIFFLSILIGACSPKADTCISNETAIVDSIYVPSTATINQTISIPVYYEVHNGCGVFQELQVSNLGNTYTFQPKVKYEGCQCTMVFFINKTDYSFKPIASGTYYFRYFNKNSFYSIDTLQVN